MHVPTLTLALSLFPLIASAAGTLDFDGAEYTGNQTVIGRTDSNVIGGGPWTRSTGTDGNIISSTWGTGVGNTGRALRITDTSVSSSQSAWIDTGTTVNTTAEFSVSFQFRATGDHALTGTRQAWVQFGRSTSDPGDRSRSWLFFDLDGSNVRLWVHDPAKPNDGFRTAVILGPQIANTYNHITAVIDPITRRYRNVVLNGVDVTNRILAGGSGGGGIPWQINSGDSPSASATLPNTHLWIVTGTDDRLTFDLDNIRLSETPENWLAQASDEWLPFINSNTSVQVVAGTALDFSALADRSSSIIDQRGFVRVDQDGDLSFADGTKARFFTAGEFMPAIGLPFPATDAQIEAYVDQLVRAGYNAFRPHFLDVYLMMNFTPGATPAQLAAINPLRLTQWQKLAARMRAKGIYLAMDASTSWNSFYPELPDRFYSTAARLRRLKVKLCYDAAARAHWKAAMETLYGEPNPYTGQNLALKDDPQVVFNNLRNEPSLIFQLVADRVTSLPLQEEPGLLAAWRAWLFSTYLTVANLNSAWGAPTAYTSFSDVPLPDHAVTTGTRYRDLRRFEVDISRDTTTWMRQVFLGIGVKSLVTDYNNISDLPTALVRDMIDLVDNHTYHDHADDGDGNILYIMKGGSSVDDVQQNFRHIAHSRLHGRPFSVTEWGYVFWNPFRYEGGLMLPSYVRLQNWSLISQHTQSVHLSPKAAASFEIGSDPVAKASEYTAALLFARGDVAPSPNRIEVVVDAVNAQTQRDAGGLLFRFKALPLLTGFGLRVNWPVIFADSFDDNSVASADTVNDQAFGPANNFWSSFVNASSTVTASSGKLHLCATGSAFPSAVVRNRVTTSDSLDVFNRSLQFDVRGPVFSSNGAPANQQVFRFALTNGTGLPYANPHGIIVEIRGNNRVTIGYKLNAPSGAYHQVRVISDLPTTPGYITGFTFEPVAVDLNEVGGSPYDPAYELVLHLAGSATDPLYRRYTGRWNVVSGATPLNPANWGSTANNTVQLEAQKIDGVVNNLHVTAALDHFSFYSRASAPRAAGQPAARSWAFPFVQNPDTDSLSGLISSLRSGSPQVLAPGNLTVAPTSESSTAGLYADGVYHSDTGQLLLEAGKRAFRVVTPRSEGITVPADKPDGSAAPAFVQSPSLRIESKPAPHVRTSFGVFLSSLSNDLNKTVNDAERLLLIVSPDAINTDMAFTNYRRTHLYKHYGNPQRNGIGTLPVLLRRVSATIRVRNINADTIKVYPLRPDGTRRAQMTGLSVETINGERWLVIPIDTGNLNGSPNDGPATCFELVTTTPLIGGFDAWRARHWPNLTDPAASALADPDGDGQPNLLEYAAGSSPVDASSLAAPRVGSVIVDGLAHLTLTFVRDLTAFDCRHFIEATGDLAAGEWLRLDALDPAHQLVVVRDMPRAGLETITVKDPVPLTGAARRFLRLRIELV